MITNEFEKVFLEIDRSLGTDRYLISLDNHLFGKEWDNVRIRQLVFLLERPLLFKVISEKRFGPIYLNALFINEFWEAEQESRKLNVKKEIDELVDMSLVLLTHDSLNPILSTQKQLIVLEDNWDTVAGYCKDLRIDKNNLVLPALNKIEINCLRNPKEAFMLVDHESMKMSVNRMMNNWLRLKEKREKHVGWFTKKEDWWKKYYYVDDYGWLRDRISVAQSY